MERVSRTSFGSKPKTGKVAIRRVDPHASDLVARGVLPDDRKFTVAAADVILVGRATVPAVTAQVLTSSASVSAAQTFASTAAPIPAPVHAKASAPALAPARTSPQAPGSHIALHEEQADATLKSEDAVARYQQALAAAIEALETIASNPAADPKQVAESALRQVKGVQLPVARFHEPLVTAVAMSACHGNEMIGENIIPTQPGLVRTTSTSSQQGSGRAALNLLRHSLSFSAHFDVVVFSVEDGVNKSIDSLTAGDSLMTLMEKIKDEFMIAGEEEICLMLGSQQLGEEAMGKTLGELQISEGTQLSYTSQETQAFSVEISTMAGDVVKIFDLLSDMNLASLINAAEKEMGVTGEECVHLISGSGEVFGLDDLGRTLGKLGISDGAQLYCTIELRPKGSCPKCRREHPVMRGVTTGATHEGWGLRWNTCNYNCMHCGVPVMSGEHVNACKLCRCFWHRSCKDRDGR